MVDSNFLVGKEVRGDLRKMGSMGGGWKRRGFRFTMESICDVIKLLGSRAYKNFSVVVGSFCSMDNGIDSAVSSLENGFVYCQARFDPSSLCSASLPFGFKKLRADKRRKQGW